MNRTEPPSGASPPAEATMPDGTALDLVSLAIEVCTRYDAEFPDERERYGPAGMEWCRHDNRYILDWAAGDVGRVLDLDSQLDWLTGLLARRGFPLERMVRNLRIAADTIRDDAPAAGELALRIDRAADRLEREIAAGRFDG